MNQDNTFQTIKLINIPLFVFNRIVKSWNIDFLQLRPGSFLGNLSQIICNDFQFGYASFNTAVKQEGTSPEGVWTFAFVNDVKIYWRNYQIEPNAIIIYAPGSEINAVSAANFEVMTFSITEEYLHKIAKKEGFHDFYHTLKSLEVLVSRNPLWEKLRNEIFIETNIHLQNQNYSNCQMFKETFTKNLLVLLKDSSINKKKVSGKKRLKMLHDAEQYILQHITEPLSVSNIASYLNISERTLLYAFRNRFDMGSKKYMLVFKLNAAYLMLHEEDNANTVSSIARTCGFWHMGQFYKDYKAFFGELPSDTLKKSFDDSQDNRINKN